MHKILFCLLLLALGSACTRKVAETAERSGPVKTVTGGQTEELAPGQGIRLPDHQATFTFVGVVSDSRCPQGVDCIRAGEAIVRIRLADGTEEELVLDAGEREGRRFALPTGEVTVLGLVPYPVARTEITPEAYRLRLQLTATENR